MPTRQEYVKALRDEAKRLLDAALTLDQLPLLPKEANDLVDEITQVSPEAFTNAVKDSLTEVNGNKVVNLNDLSKRLFGTPLNLDIKGIDL